MELVGVHITLSHSVKNIHSRINAFAVEKKKISDRIFLFSVLLTHEKKNAKQIRLANNSPTKWKLKFWGLSKVNNQLNEEGKYVQVSNENDI